MPRQHKYFLRKCQGAPSAEANITGSILLYSLYSRSEYVRKVRITESWVWRYHMIFACHKITCMWCRNSTITAKPCSARATCKGLELWARYCGHYPWNIYLLQGVDLPGECVVIKIPVPCFYNHVCPLWTQTQFHERRSDFSENINIPLIYWL